MLYLYSNILMINKWKCVNLIPGIALSSLLAILASMLSYIEVYISGHGWIGSLVIAILIGSGVRGILGIDSAFEPGIRFSSRTFLELGVVMFGASVNAAILSIVTPKLVFMVLSVVTMSLIMSYVVARMLGLPRRLSALIACGNSICGNSAIAAVAPVISADPSDVTTAIAFTAILGIGAVLGLPLIGHALHFTVSEYGVLSGLVVYAVPQVLAAAAPFGPTAIQIGTLVKLMRVMLLGPVCMLAGAMAFGHGRRHEDAARSKFQALSKALLPWYIAGFLGLAGLRTADLLPTPLATGLVQFADILIIVAMAALGLSVDLKIIRREGGRVTLSVVAALLLLCSISLLAIGTFPIM